jgi:hypothetical protein
MKNVRLSRPSQIISISAMFHSTPPYANMKEPNDKPLLHTQEEWFLFECDQEGETKSGNKVKKNI